jgi:tetratricopeptide (TPR) repeat protein
MLGRILKNQGRFHEALPYFEKLLQEFSYEDNHVSTGWQMALFSNIADLYCEVGRPDDAEAVLAREMEIIYVRRWENISTGRRLQLALIESFIRRGMFKEAEECLSKLVPIFEAITEPDLMQNTGHFRVWAGLARVFHLQGHWDDALVRWYRALGIVEGSGWTEGFNYGIILFSIAQVLARTGKLDECHAALENAQRSPAAEERKYWIVGLGSYWYDYVVTSLGEAGPSPVVMRTKETRYQISGRWETNPFSQKMPVEF